MISQEENYTEYDLPRGKLYRVWSLKRKTIQSMISQEENYTEYDLSRGKLYRVWSLKRRTI